MAGIMINHPVLGGEYRFGADWIQRGAKFTCLTVHAGFMYNTPTSTVSTTATSLSILETVKELDGATVEDIARACDLAPSTAFKHLATLEAAAFLTKEGEAYHLGLKFLNYGEYARNRRPEQRVVEEAVRTLTDRTDEEVDYIVEDHGLVYTVAESYHKWVKYAERDATYRARLGQFYHMHATATGKAILAAYDREQIEAIIDRWGLPARTENTITERDALFAELDACRDRGWAYDFEEYTNGLCSVGMVVERPETHSLASMSVSGPSYRLAGDVIREEVPNTMNDVIADLEAEIAGFY